MSMCRYLRIRQPLYRSLRSKNLQSKDCFNASFHSRAACHVSLKNEKRQKKHELLHGSSTSQMLSSRSFWGVDVAFNKVDEERVRLAGPDRACAEWVLRNGGEIRWVSSAKYVKNYNLLPTTDFANYKIEDIDLRAAGVTGMGFLHLENINHLKVLKLHGCRSMRDDALSHLHFVKDSLEFLEISRCPMVTEKGLNELHILRKLKKMVIYNLIEIKDLSGAVSDLKRTMPWCHFDTVDPDEEPET